MEIASQQFEMPTQERAIDLRAEFDSFAEMSACGTAAVLSPVGRVYFDSKWHIVNGDGYTVGPVMQKLYDSLVQLQEVRSRTGLAGCTRLRCSVSASSAGPVVNV